MTTRGAWLLACCVAVACGKSASPPPAPAPPPTPVVTQPTARAADPAQLAALQQQIDALIAENQPKLDAFIARIATLKKAPGNLPGWESTLRLEQLANDRVGLSPFENTTPEPPGRIPSTTSLIGMGIYAHKHAAELAAAGKLSDLQFLVDDTRKRYADSEAYVEDYLTQSEHWLAAAVAAMPKK